MHQTTTRFSSELWSEIERESERLGISAAQYIREATLARLAYSAAERGDPGWHQTLRPAGAGTPLAVDFPARDAELADAELEAEAPARQAILRSRDEVNSSEAVWAQARQARKRAQELRDQTAGRWAPADPAPDS